MFYYSVVQKRDIPATTSQHSMKENVVMATLEREKKQGGGPFNFPRPLTLKEKEQNKQKKKTIKNLRWFLECSK